MLAQKWRKKRSVNNYEQLQDIATNLKLTGWVKTSTVTHSVHHTWFSRGRMSRQCEWSHDQEMRHKSFCRVHRYRKGGMETRRIIHTWIRKQNLTMNSSLTVYRVSKHFSIDHPVGHVEDIPRQTPRRLLVRVQDGLTCHAEAHENHQHDHHKVQHVNHLHTHIETPLLFGKHWKMRFSHSYLSFHVSSHHFTNHHDIRSQILVNSKDVKDTNVPEDDVHTVDDTSVTHVRLILQAQ